MLVSLKNSFTFWLLGSRGNNTFIYLHDRYFFDSWMYIIARIRCYFHFTQKRIFAVYELMNFTLTWELNLKPVGKYKIIMREYLLSILLYWKVFDARYAGLNMRVKIRICIHRITGWIYYLYWLKIATSLICNLFMITSVFANKQHTFYITNIAC